MEEHKNHNKVSRLIIILVIAVTVIIAILAYLMISQKSAADKQIAALKASEAELQATVAELQGKLANISDIAGTTTGSITENQVSIEGTYVSNAGSEREIYTFLNGNVKYESLGSTNGTYEINGNTITIKYEKQNIDPDGETVNNDYLKGETETLTIENDSTIVSSNGTKYVKE